MMELKCIGKKFVGEGQKTLILDGGGFCFERVNFLEGGQRILVKNA